MSTPLDYPFARSGSHAKLSQGMRVDRPRILSVRTGSADGLASASCPNGPQTRWTAGDKHQPSIPAHSVRVGWDGRESCGRMSSGTRISPAQATVIRSIERHRDVRSQVGESPRTIRPRDGIGKAGLLLVPQPRPTGHTSTIASGIGLRTYARKEGRDMAGQSRIVRLTEDVDDYQDQFVSDMRLINQVMSDGIVNEAEWIDVRAAMERTDRALTELAFGIQIVADSHQLAKQALSSDGVSPWVVRSAQEKGADYLRLVPDNVVPFRQPERRTAS